MSFWNTALASCLTWARKLSGDVGGCYHASTGVTAGKRHAAGGDRKTPTERKKQKEKEEGDGKTACCCNCARIHCGKAEGEESANGRAWTFPIGRREAAWARWRLLLRDVGRRRRKQQACGTAAIAAAGRYLGINSGDQAAGGEQKSRQQTTRCSNALARGRRAKNAAETAMGELR